MSVRDFRSLARDWDTFGKTDPLFGILSDPTKQGGKWDVAEFFDSGSAHVQHLFEILASLNIFYRTGACLDFGCGVGRLTVPLSERFGRTVGVDVSPAMIERARAFHLARSGCEFVVNRSADLRQFPAATFDVVHSCLVLQHIVPETSLGYIREFFRVATRDGLVAFQLPAATYSEAAITAKHMLPDDGYVARITLIDPPAVWHPSEVVTITVELTNESRAIWRDDIPSVRQICVANHWLHEDGGVAVPDDGRSRLSRTLAPGESMQIALAVTAPPEPGRYLLEVDLVQEAICWFAQKGSPTARWPVVVERGRVTGGAGPASGAGETAPGDNDSRSGSTHHAHPREPSLLGKLSGKLMSAVVQRLRPVRRPTFSMYTVPRAEVEALIRACGGELLDAIDDNAAGPGWLSYTYVCRAGVRPSALRASVGET